MTEFLKEHKLHLTPLSPIHMGSGEDFEPTQYVIEKGFLQLFDPSNLALPQGLRAQLLQLAARSLPLAKESSKRDNKAMAPFISYILGLHDWFKHNSTVIARSAYHYVALSPIVAKEYEIAFGKARNEGEAINQFEIERAAYHPITGAVYIPGSAFKGMVRTTWLEHLATKEKSKITQLRPGKNLGKEYERELLNGFEKDPMRLFKPGDFMPQGNNVYSVVQYSINKYKKQPEDATKDPMGLKVRRECIVEGQYRAFCSSTVLQQTLGKIPVSQLSIRELAKKCNQYYLKRFHQECSLMMNRGFLNIDWWQSTKALLSALDSKLQAGDLMLVRLGKNTGAESKTDDQFASIKIMQGKNKEHKFEKQTTTLWLASDGDTRGDMLPFGWALVEIDPEENLTELQEWCSKNNRVENIAQRFSELQQYQQEIVAKAIAEAEAEAKAEAEREAVKREEEARIANMSIAERMVYDIQEALQQPGLGPNTEEGQMTLAMLIEKLNEALTFTSTEQKIVADALSFSQLKVVVSKKREKEIKALLRQLRGEA